MDKKDQYSIEDLCKEFQYLYDQMQLPEHKKAVDAFFEATAEELNSTYRESGPNTSVDSDPPN